MFNMRTVGVIVLGVAMMAGDGFGQDVEIRSPEFEYVEVDGQGAGRTAIGDIDGDGMNDIVLHTWSSNRGKDKNGSVSWYQYPTWKKHMVISGDHLFGDGVVVVDLNHDGQNDIVSCKGNDNAAEVWWFENTGQTDDPWVQHFIATVEEESEVKDIEVVDIDDDGRLDVVVRTKNYFAVYFQDESDEWFERKIKNRPREGMAVGDLDMDGDEDVVMNGYWLENPDKPRTDHWPMHIIDEQWYKDNTGGWQDFSVMAAVADFNNDGRNDVAFSHSEKPGFSVTWYANTLAPGLTAAPDLPKWTKHQLAIIDYCHTLRAADMNNDGHVDLVAGTLIRTDIPSLVIIMNQGNGQSWTATTVANKSVYKAKTGDIDNDGDVDITSALSWEAPPVQLWRNKLNDRPTEKDDN